MPLTDQEARILASIVVPSENDPHKPEFPTTDPKFPARPTYKIVVPIVSSGSAATAIQAQLRMYGLPPLKVLMDSRTNRTIIASLRQLGCEVTTTDLEKKALSSKEILALTQNEDGLDISSNEALNPDTRFYDWLSYEILNSSPSYCFIPYGTGNLFENILNINRKELTSRRHDPRFRGEVEQLRRCHFLGATSHNSRTKATKLYSAHLPFARSNDQWMRLYRSAGYCGDESGVYEVEEKFLDQAMNLAEHQGISAEFSGIAGLALMLQLSDTLPKDQKMLIVNTCKTRYRL